MAASPAYRSEYAEHARKLCALYGATDREIAAFLSNEDGPVSEPFAPVRARDVRRWKLLVPEFREACALGDAVATQRVKESLLKLATGFTRREVKILPPPKDCGREPIYAPFIAHHDPNLGAVKFWLINRGAGQWVDEKSVAIRSAPNSMEDLTDAELAAIARSGAAQPAG